MATIKVKTRAQLREELVNALLEILRPQLDGQPVVSNEQREEMIALLARGE
jgi:hypothetical protein